ncbi:WecB/TagA/CpsF family glycosyltransferase [Bradyrhizobium ganzhouense]|uniref:WecB/TagA/CpsF family glycosyltransferase n=1 Tax=Bradyrhizobium ganzhouense TaxID=1179767 RepID=UPI003CEBC761
MRQMIAEIAEIARIQPSLESGRRRTDALSRPVFGIAGLPIDAVGIDDVLEALEAVIRERRPFLISTPNLHFLIKSLGDEAFRASLLLSDLCPADGMPIVWISRLLGVEAVRRVSGADIFDVLRAGRPGGRARSIFLFGGPGDTAHKVGKAINSEAAGLRCVGSLNPGFGSIDQLSDPAVLAAINSSGADMLAVFLNADKAQTWLLRNHHRLRPPVRAQLGATINFQAGTVRRAPAFIRDAGFEWLWRIKEEPYLWRRYLRDGLSLLRVIATSVVPFRLNAVLLRLRSNYKDLKAQIIEQPDRTLVRLSGAATKEHIAEAIARFRQALDRHQPLVVDLASTSEIDPRFFGLLLLVRKELESREQSLDLVHAPPAIARAFRLNGFNFLLGH